MNICEQCGSSSRDKSGICAGCAAAWPLTIPHHAATPVASQTAEAYAELPARISSFGLVEVRPKRVGAAVLFALLFGPIGLLYCTTTGAIVLTIVSIVLMLVLRQASFLVILPICVIWAWRAARESESLFG